MILYWNVPVVVFLIKCTWSRGKQEQLHILFKVILSFSTGLRNSNSDDPDSNTECNFDEEAIISYYFSHGFEYNEILLFFVKYHNHYISYSMLLRRLRQYGLCRRKQPSEEVFKEVRKRIKEIIDGPGSMGGYRTVWHTLELEGFRVP